MSTQQIIIRCDHAGCNKTTDLLDIKTLTGWLRNEIAAFAPVRILLDYCPDHSAAHVTP